MNKYAIRSRIAEEHKITLDDNDPAWILVTVCEEVAESSLKKIKEERKNTEKKINELQLIISFLSGLAIGIIVHLLLGK